MEKSRVGASVGLPRAYLSVAARASRLMAVMRTKLLQLYLGLLFCTLSLISCSLLLHFSHRRSPEPVLVARDRKLLISPGFDVSMKVAAAERLSQLECQPCQQRC